MGSERPTEFFLYAGCALWLIALAAAAALVFTTLLSCASCIGRPP